jgi:hypothetical protein
MDDMGTLRTIVRVAHIARLERFETADGSVIERDIAFALVPAGPVPVAAAA